MITKVREARNERLIRSPFHNWHLLDAISDMNIQAAASPAAAIARGFFISGQTATAIPAHHEASSNAPNSTIMFGC
jgi:hypothetical protein